MNERTTNINAQDFTEWDSSAAQDSITQYFKICSCAKNDMESSAEVKTHLGQNIFLISRMMANIANAKARSFGIGGESFVVLSAINAAPRNISHLSAALFKDKTTISREVDGLCRKGLAKKVKSEFDARVVNVRITPRGAEILSGMKDKMCELKSVIEGAISSEEIAACNRVLEKLNVAIRATMG